MKSIYKLNFAVSYNADSPIKEEVSEAVIEAYDFNGAYDKANQLVDAMQLSPNVLAIEILSLRSVTRRRMVWQKS